MLAPTIRRRRSSSEAAASSFAGDDRVVAVNDAGALGDRVGGQRVVARHHLDPHARGLALTDGRGDFGAHGVPEAEQAEDRQIAFVVLASRAEACGSTPGDRQHAYPLGGEPAVRLLDGGAVRGADRRMLEDPLQRALGGDAHRLRPAGGRPDVRHVLADGIEVVVPAESPPGRQFLR